MLAKRERWRSRGGRRRCGCKTAGEEQEEQEEQDKEVGGSCYGRDV
eukprot:COSAG03_NODE_1259_length_4450_cov_2.393703_1_plen_46_part_00